MADTAADTGYGVILKKETSTPGSYADYGLEVTAVNGVGFSRSSADATHHQSADEHAEFVHGITTTKPITVEVNWLPSSTSAIQVLTAAGKANWQILFTDNTSVSFRAAITDFEAGSLTPDGKMSATVQFTPSGKATWA